MGLAALSQAAELTQVELARRMGVTQATATKPSSISDSSPKQKHELSNGHLAQQAAIIGNFIHSTSVTVRSNFPRSARPP